MAETGKSKTCAWRWQERFMQEGVDGLLRDRSRPPGKAPVAPEWVAEIVRLTLEPPPFWGGLGRTSGIGVARLAVDPQGDSVPLRT